MTKLPPPTSLKLQKELARRAAERLKGHDKSQADADYGKALSLPKKTSAKIAKDIASG